MPPYKDRRHAGRVLAEELFARNYGPQAGGSRVLVLALPRGGVPVGFEVAERLKSELDVFVVRKLGVPSNPELAMGAIASGGSRVLNEPVVRKLGITDKQVAEVAEMEMQELMRRESEYRGDLAPLDPGGASIVLVDDGLATGATMSAAIEAVRGRGPARITVAVPVAPTQTARRLRSTADEVVAAIEADNFVAVGQWYEDFSQTTDDQVRNLLRLARMGHGDRMLS